jgi:hypothetical protein
VKPLTTERVDTTEMIRLENETAGLVAAALQLRAVRLPRHYGPSHMLSEGPKPVWCLEVRHRNFASNKFPSIWMPAGKLSNGMAMAANMQLPYMICFRFTDNILCWWPSRFPAETVIVPELVHVSADRRTLPTVEIEPQCVLELRDFCPTNKVQEKLENEWNDHEKSASNPQVSFTAGN